MITDVRLSNYRCFRSAKLQLDALTVLVGGNGCGKSALLRAMLPGGLTDKDVWQHSGVECLIQIGGLGSALEKRLPVGAQASNHVSGSDHKVQLLRLDPAKIRQRVNVERSQLIHDDGTGVVNVFATLSRDEQIEVSHSLCQIIPLFHAIEHGPSVGAGQHELRFRDRWNPKQAVYLVDEISDGTLLTFAYLLLSYQDPQPQLLLIEEPERGLHPYLMGEIVSLLRKLSRGEFGRPPIQIVMATHSAELVNQLEPQEVRFLRRVPADGSVVIESAPTNDPNWKRALDEYDSLGSMWLSGGLGGVPGN